MCCNRDYGCILALVISIFIGIIIGVLFFFGLIPTIIPGIWIAFGLAVLSLIILALLSASDTQRDDKCICMYGNCLLAGIFGTIITAIIALVITLAIETVLSAIVIAILGFFLSLLLITLIIFIKCFIDANCRFRD